MFSGRGQRNSMILVCIDHIRKLHWILCLNIHAAWIATLKTSSDFPHLAYVPLFYFLIRILLFALWSNNLLKSSLIKNQESVIRVKTWKIREAGSSHQTPPTSSIPLYKRPRFSLCPHLITLHLFSKSIWIISVCPLTSSKLYLGKDNQNTIQQCNQAWHALDITVLSVVKWCCALVMLSSPSFHMAEVYSEWVRGREQWDIHKSQGLFVHKWMKTVFWEKVRSTLIDTLRLKDVL